MPAKSSIRQRPNGYTHRTPTRSNGNARTLPSMQAVADPDCVAGIGFAPMLVQCRRRRRAAMVLRSGAAADACGWRAELKLPCRCVTRPLQGRSKKKVSICLASLVRTANDFLVRTAMSDDLTIAWAVPGTTGSTSWSTAFAQPGGLEALRAE
jgi:hypothetical protein